MEAGKAAGRHGRGGGFGGRRPVLVAQGQCQGWEQAQRKEQTPLPLCTLSSRCQLSPLGGCGESFSKSASWSLAPFLLPSEPFHERKFIKGNKCLGKLRDPPKGAGPFRQPQGRSERNGDKALVAAHGDGLADLRVWSRAVTWVSQE